MSASSTPNKVVYTVTIIDHSDFSEPEVYHTPGIFTTLKGAMYVIENNTFDLSEGGSTEYAVIEKTELDTLYPVGETHWWYKWNREEEIFESCDPPTKFFRVCGFGIG